MKISGIYNNKEFLKQIQSAQEIANIINTPAMQEAWSVVNSPVVQQAYQSISVVSRAMESIQPVFDRISVVSESVQNNIDHHLQELNGASSVIQATLQRHSLDEIIAPFRGVLADYDIMYCYSDNISDEETVESKEIDNKIVTEIFEPDEKTDKTVDKKELAIITLSPVNDMVLKYLSENPEALYQLTDRDFEIVMAEIYNKLGYKVEITKETRDGGKDIIIRKPDILGDFIYYVECKKYAAKRHIGVGIIRNLVGTVNTDRVNGGILATTSYFTPDARKFIIDNKYDYQIQMHDYNKIREMLNRVV